MQDEFELVDQYWKAANYLTVAFMYLKSNIFLTEKLSEKNLKEFPAGHWGTSPGINFIYAHLCSFISRTKQHVQLVIGPGHAGNAIFSNLLLEGTLQEYYSIHAMHDRVEFDVNLINKLISKIRTECNPYYPGTIYDGGELGYSLPVSFGSVLDKKDLLTVCVIGDGEFETATISSAWRCKEYMSDSSGFVLPIIHFNGYRMGNQSLLSLYKEENIKSYFKSMGYEAKLIHLNHLEMSDALNWANRMYCEIKQGVHNVWPVIILHSPKGYSAPDQGMLRISGTAHSHKDPLRKLNGKEKVAYLETWLKSYHPESLFDTHHSVNKSILSIIPEAHLKLGKILNQYLFQELALPSAKQYMFSISDSPCNISNISILTSYLTEVIKRNKGKFRIVSPDELKSNLLGELIRLGSEQRSTKNDVVMEILNENICQAWMQGYILTGRNALMVGYEAFMPVITSMVSQISKWIRQSKQIKWRENTASFTYILTSLWEANTFSHQNPEFADNLIGKNNEFIRLYFPIDGNSLLACVEKCLSSKNLINIIVVTKQKMRQYFDKEIACSSSEIGIYYKDYFNSQKQDVDIVFAACGDYPARECIEGIQLLQYYLPKVKMRFVSVLELTTLGDCTVYPHAMDQKNFQTVFTKEAPIVFCYHGYGSTIKALMFQRVSSKRLQVLGYKNRSIISTHDLNKMILNENSRYHIVLAAINFLKDKIETKKIEIIRACMQQQIRDCLNGIEL